MAFSMHCYIYWHLLDVVEKMNREKKLKILEKLALAYTIWCFATAGLGIYGVFYIMNMHKDNDASIGILTDLKYNESYEYELTCLDYGGCHMVEHNIEVIVSVNGSEKIYRVMQNMSEEYLRNKYVINKTYIVLEQEGNIRGLVDDNKFNRWLTRVS